MKNKEILRELKLILAEYVEEKSMIDDLGLDTNLIQNLNIDSYNLVEIVLDVESKFNISIDDSSIGKMEIVKDCIKVIKDALTKKECELI